LAEGRYHYLRDHDGLIHRHGYHAPSGQPAFYTIRRGQLGCDNKVWERTYAEHTEGTSSSSSGAADPDECADLSPPVRTASATSWRRARAVRKGHSEAIRKTPFENADGGRTPFPILCAPPVFESLGILGFEWVPRATLRF
jgi:hypothetical protein